MSAGGPSAINAYLMTLADTKERAATVTVTVART